jgi:hypothetical protein
MATCTWPIGNNETLEFIIYDPNNTTWNQAPGLYIFAYLVSPGKWRALYVGKTDDFSDRLPYHPRWSEATQLGATHVHALVIERGGIRDNAEELLIQQLQPPMNVQLR